MKRTVHVLEVISYHLTKEEVNLAIRGYIINTICNETKMFGVVKEDATFEWNKNDGSVTVNNKYSRESQV